MSILDQKVTTLDLSIRAYNYLLRACNKYFDKDVEVTTIGEIIKLSTADIFGVDRSRKTLNEFLDLLTEHGLKLSSTGFPSQPRPYTDENGFSREADHIFSAWRGYSRKNIDKITSRKNAGYWHIAHGPIKDLYDALKKPYKDFLHAHLTLPRDAITLSHILENKPTRDAFGRDYDITRERIRQITYSLSALIARVYEDQLIGRLEKST